MSAERQPPIAVTLSVPARSEYLMLCRLALAGLAGSRPLTDEELADLKLALTEACANVVRHAYADGGGRIEVTCELRPADDSVVIVVADRGRGFAGDTLVPASEGYGLGLRLIEALTDELEIAPGSNGRGTVVRMMRKLGRPRG